MRILGVDPGLSITGYGVIDSMDGSFKLVEAGIVRTRPADGIKKRLERIYTNLSELIDEHGPEVLVLEKLYAHYKHPTTALLMGHARGIVCLLSSQKNVRLVSYPSTRIKKAVVGTGHASKEQVAGMVKGLLGLKSMPRKNDVTDALAIAMSYVFIERV